MLFSLDGSLYAPYPNSGYLAPTGNHTLRAQNATGCLSGLTTVLIDAVPFPPTVVNVSITEAACGLSNGALVIGTVTGGRAPYSYSVDGSGFTQL